MLGEVAVPTTRHQWLKEQLERQARRERGIEARGHGHVVLLELREHTPDAAELQGGRIVDVGDERAWLEIPQVGRTEAEAYVVSGFHEQAHVAKSISALIGDVGAVRAAEAPPDTLAAVAAEPRREVRVAAVPDDHATAGAIRVVGGRMPRRERSRRNVVVQGDFTEDTALQIGAIAVVVELLLSAEDHRGAAIPGAWPGPGTHDAPLHPLVVRPRERGEVVHFEARALPVLRRLETPVAALLGEASVQPIAAKRSARRIIPEVEQAVVPRRTVRPLEVVRARLLRPPNGPGVAHDFRHRDLAHERVASLAPVVLDVGPDYPGTPPEPARVRRVRQDAVGQRRDQTDARVTLPEVLPHAADEVVRPWFHAAGEHLAARGGSRHVPGRHAIRERLQHRDGEST